MGYNYIDSEPIRARGIIVKYLMVILEMQVLHVSLLNAALL